LSRPTWAYAPCITLCSCLTQLGLWRSLSAMPPSIRSCVYAGLLVALLTGCGLEFKPKKAEDAGVDAGVSGGNGDSGGGGNGGPDGPASTLCTKDADCGDVERFRCGGSGTCEEYACHASKGCSGADVCDDHVCGPFTPPERFPVGYSQTSGGGSASSSKYRLRLSAGTPQPFGVASSSKYRMVLGPGAGRP
jgi:hypothetical protein